MDSILRQSGSDPRNTNGERREDRLGGAIVFLFVLAIYWITLAPSVSFWDSGEFIASSYTLAIPHPPGTPLYVILGRVFTLLPIFSIAGRVNFLSALPAALSAFFLYHSLLLIGRRFTNQISDPMRSRLYRAGAAAGALFAAFGSTTWTNAIESEVYALSNLVITFCLWILLRWSHRRNAGKDRRPLLLVAYLLSLSIGIHLGTYLALPAFALLVLAVDGRAFLDPRFLALSILITLLGITVHAYLPIRSTLNPVIDEANPETIDEMKDFVLRKQYKPSKPWIRQASWSFQIGMYWRYFTSQFGGLLPLLGIAGAVAHGIRDRRSFPLYALLFLITSLFLVFYMNFTDHEVRERDYFFAPSFFFWGGWMGVGAAAFIDTLRTRLQVKDRTTATLALIVVLALPATTLATNFHSHDRRGNFIARDYAWNILTTLEPDAILFTNGDNDTFPLWYLQEVEHVRKDVRIVNLALLNTSWYIWQLKHLEPKISIAWTDKDIQELKYLRPFQDAEGKVIYLNDLAIGQILRVAGSTRPVYFAVTISDLRGLDEAGLLELEGLVFRMHDSPVDPTINVEICEKNLWEDFRYTGILDENGQLIDEVYRTRHQKGLITNYSGAYSRLAIHYRNLGRFDDAIRNLRRAGVLSPSYRPYTALMGPLLVGAKRFDEALRFFGERVDASPDSVASYVGIAYIREMRGEWEAAEQWYRSAIGVAPESREAYVRLARMLARENDIIGATQVLETWLAIDPNDKSTHVQLQELRRGVIPDDQNGEARRVGGES